jgi:hypothetical protein
MFQHPDPFSTVAFMVVCGFVLTCMWIALKRSGQRVMRIGCAVLAWQVLAAAAVVFVLNESEPLPGALVFLAVSNLAGLGFALSPIGGRIAGATSLSALVGFQVFRLPLELILHRWVGDGVIPATMTWTGQNWDIVTGLLAAGIAPFANRRPALAWVFNIVGGVLLLNVGRVALLSSPVPFGWDVTPKLLLVFHLPYALIVPICVAGALAGHVILTRALLKRA